MSNTEIIGAVGGPVRARRRKQAKRKDAVDSGPFAAWLREVVAQCDGEVKRAARVLGVDDSQLGRWLRQKTPTVSVWKVDEVFIRYQDPGALYRLYSLDEAEVA